MGKVFKVLIAEDQPEARKFMKKLIPLVHPSFEVVEEASDGEELIDKLFTVKPDVVFVDIEMPKMKGIDAIKRCLEVKPDLKFIFTTAYDTFALEAFNLKAMDYIVKPVKKERLYGVLERVYKTLLLEEGIQNKGIYRNKLPIRYNRSLYYVSLEDIFFIEKQGRKSLIHTNKEVYSTYETLDEIMEYLDHRFFQSHRSFIINLTKVFEVRTSGQSYLVYFDDYDIAAQISKNNIKMTYQQIEKFSCLTSDNK